MTLKAVNVLLGALLLYCAAVQYNDPDPWLWIPIYGLAAVVSMLAVLGRYPRPLLLVATLACLLGMAPVVPGFLEWLLHHPFRDIAAEMSAERMYIEHSREFLGLVLVAATLGFHWWCAPRHVS